MLFRSDGNTVMAGRGFRLGRRHHRVAVVVRVLGDRAEVGAINESADLDGARVAVQVGVLSHLAYEVRGTVSVMFGYVEVNGSSHDREVTLDRRFGRAIDTAAESGNRDGRDDPDNNNDDDQLDETESAIESMFGKAHVTLSDQKGVVAMAGSFPAST